MIVPVWTLKIDYEPSWRIPNLQAADIVAEHREGRRIVICQADRVVYGEYVVYAYRQLGVELIFIYMEDDNGSGISERSRRQLERSGQVAGSGRRSSEIKIRDS